jgi:hypothetical protein
MSQEHTSVELCPCCNSIANVKDSDYGLCQSCTTEIFYPDLEPMSALDYAVDEYLSRSLGDQRYPDMVVGDVLTVHDIHEFIDLGIMVFDGHKVYDTPHKRQE